MREWTRNKGDGRPCGAEPGCEIKHGDPMQIIRPRLNRETGRALADWRKYRCARHANGEVPDDLPELEETPPAEPARPIGRPRPKRGAWSSPFATNTFDAKLAQTGERE